MPFVSRRNGVKDSFKVFSFMLLVSLTALANGPMILEPTQIFVPHGFDSNDQSEVLLTGWLPSPCFTQPKVDVDVRGRVINISLKSHAKTRDFCIAMAYPYVVKARLGQLKKGSYRILVNDESPVHLNAAINIAAATSGSMDDFIYAQIEDVIVDEVKQTVTLTGYNPSDCIELDTIHFISNKKDTIAVLPIMKQVKTLCDSKLAPFKYVFDIPKLLPSNNHETFLLHVRSLEGTSVNKLVRSR